MKNQYNLKCNIAQTLNVIGDKWALLVIHEIMVGNQTYKEIQEKLVGIPTNLLATRLKELEEHGIIENKPYQEHPPRSKYMLTQKGMDLRPVFYSLIIWGEKYLEDKCYKHLIHESCGHMLEQEYYCPECKKVVKQEEMKIVEAK